MYIILPHIPLNWNEGNVALNIGELALYKREHWGTDCLYILGRFISLDGSFDWNSLSCEFSGELSINNSVWFRTFIIQMKQI